MIYVVLVLLVIFCPLAIDLYLPAMPQMASALSASDTAVQSSILLFMVSVGTAQLLFGPLSDKYGRRPIALLGIICYVTGALVAANALSINVLLGGRIIQGLGAAATFVTTFALVRDNFNSNKSAQILSYLNGIVCFIPALAPLLGAWLTIKFGWQSNFYFLALFGTACFLFLMLFLPKNVKKEAQQSTSANKISYIKILLTPLFYFNASTCLLAMAAILAFVAQAPSYLIGERGLSEQMFTFWFSINAIVSIIASFSAPILIKRATKYALNVGLILMVFAGFALVFLTPMFGTVLAFMLAVFIGSIGFSFTLGAAAGSALAPFKQNAGKASALLGLLQMSGAGLLVSFTQYANLSIPLIIAGHLMAVIPFLLLINSKLQNHFIAQSETP